jgi:hypothetical protein
MWPLPTKRQEIGGGNPYHMGTGLGLSSSSVVFDWDLVADGVEGLDEEEARNLSKTLGMSWSELRAFASSIPGA